MRLRDDFVNAGASMAAGGLNMAITNPLDTLRIRWQVDLHAREKSLSQFSARIVRTEGLMKGLWRPALGTNTLLCSCTVGIRLGAYQSMRDRLVGVTGSKGPATMWLAGLLSGACGYFVGAPLYLAKNRLQSEAGLCGVDGVLLTGARKGHARAASNGAALLLSTVNNEGGVTALWRGSGVLVLRGAMLSSSQLLGYDGSKTLLRRLGFEDGTAVHLIASCAAALTLTTGVMPLDVVLTRYQTDALKRWNSPLRCCADIVRRSGPLILWRGWTAMLVRMLPSSVITFYLYESIRWFGGIGYLR